MPRAPIAVLIVLAVSSICAYAQAPAGDAARQSPPGAAADVAATQAPRDAMREPARARDDPRVCLEFATNLEVHQCAEKYRPHPHRA